MQKYGADQVECVTLSQKHYLENMPKLKAAIEDRSLLFPADDYLTSDIAMIKLMAGVPMVPQGAHNDDRDGGERHGDFAPSVMLAYEASLEDFVEIDFKSAGPREMATVFGQTSQRINYGRGFGTVGGGNDFRGY